MQFQGFDWLSGHEPLYRAREIATILVVIAKRNQQDPAIFVDCFQRAIYHLISNKREWNNCANHLSNHYKTSCIRLATRKTSNTSLRYVTA